MYSIIIIKKWILEAKVHFSSIFLTQSKLKKNHQFGLNLPIRSRIYPIFKRQRTLASIQRNFILLIFSVQSMIFAQNNIGIHQEQSEYYKIHYNESSRQQVPGPIYPKSHRNRTPSKEIFGYHPYWMGTAWTNYNFDLITTLAFFSAEVNANGSLGDIHGWPITDLINEAHAHGTDVVLCATLFSSSDITTLLSSATNRQNCINNLLAQVQAGNADGVNIDFESFPSSQRDNMVTFITDLTETFHTEIPGSQVTLAMPAVDWNDAWDYNALASISDGLFIMGYAYYWSGSSTSGPNSPLTGSGYNLTWTVNDYLNKTNNQADKIILGIPYYGREWPTETDQAGSQTTGSGDAKFYAEMEGRALSYGKIWHESSQTPWYRYENPNWFQGWYDDSLSLSLKYDFAIDQNLKGVGVWALGYDGNNTELWDLFSAKFGATAPPTSPHRISITNTSNSSIIIQFQGADTADEFFIYRRNPSTNTDELFSTHQQRPIVMDNLNQNELYLFSIRASNTHGESPQTEVLGVVPSSQPVKCLIVNGFDRVNGTTNTFDFIRQHGGAIFENGYAFDSATNEAIMHDELDLSQYQFVDWILGEEGTATSAFIGSEQDRVESYLENGGFLFVSGSEIGYDLSAQGSTADQFFLENYLKTEYISDAAGGQQGTYSGYGITGSALDQVTNITFDNGTHGTYDVDWPDGIKPVNGGSVCAKFNGVDYNSRGGMGNQYIGSFGSSTLDGGVIILSVGFETLYPASKRNEVMDHILSYYELELSTEYNSPTPMSKFITIYSLYPNPTNTSFTIDFSTSSPEENVSISILNIKGQLLLNTTISESPETHQSWIWNGLDQNGLDVPTGIYIVQVRNQHHIATQKVTLLK